MAAMALISASATGQPEEVQRLLRCRVQINHQDEEGWSALMKGSVNGHTRVVEILQSHGAQVNLQDNFGKSALMRASIYGHLGVIKVLLKSGAQVNQQDNNGDSALVIASENGHVNTVKLLLSNNAQVNLQEGAALLKAGANGHIKVVRLLLQHGAKVNLQQDNGKSALMNASESGFIEVVELLLQSGASVNLQDAYGQCALGLASKYGHEAVSELLLKNGAQVDLIDNLGKSSLLYASRNGHMHVIKLLLQYGAQVDLQDKGGWSALTRTSDYEHFEVVKLLLQHGAQIDLVNNDGESALIRAAMNNNIELVKILLRCGAYIDKQDNIKRSALMRASEKGYTEMIRILLQNNAQVLLQENDGQSALMKASVHRNTEVAQILLEYNAQIDQQDSNGWSALFIASNHGHYKLVELLIQRGAEVNLQDLDGESVLMLSSKKGYSEIVELLLESGASVNLKDDKGQSALMGASENGHTEVAKLLIQNGACVNLQDRHGQCALFQASRSGHTQVVELLQRSGARGYFKSRTSYVFTKTAKNYRGERALIEASKDGNYEVVKSLLKGNPHKEGRSYGKTALKLVKSLFNYKQQQRGMDTLQRLLQNEAEEHMPFTTDELKDGTSLLIADAFHQAMENGHLAVADLLLQNEAKEHNNMSFTTDELKDGKSLLIVASANGYVNIVEKLLLEGNPDEIDLQDDDGMSALIRASEGGHAQVVEVLLRNSAQINLTDNFGKSALMRASTNGHVKTVRSLLKKEAEVDLQDRDGWSALMSASANSHIEVAKLLLQYGAQVNLQGKSEESALTLAKDPELIDLIQGKLSSDENKLRKTEEETVVEESEGQDSSEATKDDINDYETTDEERAELQQFIKGIDDAIAKNGKIDRKLANIMFVGPTGSGKSLLMNRLLCRLKEAVSSSTCMCEDIIVVDIDMPNPSTLQAATILEDMWKEMDFEASFVRQMGPENISVFKQVRCEVQVTAASKPVCQMVAQSLKVQTVGETTNYEASSLRRSSSFHEATSFPNIEPLGLTPVASPGATIETIPIHSTIQSIINKYGFKTFKNYLKKTGSLYLRDTGGQVEFQEMLALLTFGPCIFFFIFRADLDFKSKFEVKYRKSADEFINCYTSSITTEEALLQCLASVYAMDASDVVKTHEPLVFIVGTHIDKLGSDRDTKLTVLDQQLESSIKSNGFSDLVQYADKRRGRIMFAVDNTSLDEDSFQFIRSRVNNLVIEREMFNIEYPINYLLFCLDLQNIKESIVTLEDFSSLAATHGITRDRVPHLLQFLQIRIGLIRYFDVEGLHHVIIKEPQVLFNRATDLVVRTYSSKSLTTVEECDLENKGIITLSVFNSVVSVIDKLSPEVFLQLLVHLRIAAPFPGDKEKRYFFPCVLNHVPESTGEEDQHETSVLPLAIKFECHHCPKGIYGVLVTHLMRPEGEEHKITFSLIEDKIFKDQVSFTVHSGDDQGDDQDEISLQIFSSHIEVKFFPELSDDPDDRISPLGEVCNSVRQVIEMSIFRSLKDLHYNKKKVGPVMCFKCKHCTQLHPVSKKKNYHITRCGRQVSRIPPSGRCWYNEVDTGAVTPRDDTRALTPRDDRGQEEHPSDQLSCNVLFRELLPLASEWKNIGTLLEIPTEELDIIQTSNPHKPKDCIREMINTWLSRIDPKPTWEKIVETVEPFNPKKAEDIHHKYINKQ